MFSSLLQTWVPSFQSFLEAKLPESSSHQPDTHAYRFVDQFLKNSSLLFRADEFENYKTQIRLVKHFRKYFFILFSLDRFALSLEAGCGILLADFSTVKTLVEKIFITTRSGLSLLFEQRVAYFNPLFLSVKPSVKIFFLPFSPDLQNITALNNFGGLAPEIILINDEATFLAPESNV